MKDLRAHIYADLADDIDDQILVAVYVVEGAIFPKNITHSE
jgi:hypothetical protein